MADEESKAKLNEYISKLREYGVQAVDVAFSGSGDEGYINETILTPSLHEDFRFDKEGFDDALYGYLDPARVGDWVNNEGGFGEIKIDVATGVVTGEIHFNEMTYTTEPLNDQL